MTNRRHLPAALILLSAVLVGFVVGAAAEQSPYDRKKEQEARWAQTGPTLLPYKPNYILPFSYNTNPNEGPSQVGGDPKARSTETKFQISLEVPIARGVIYGRGNLFFGYTQLSMWQLYNRKYSAPFRDTNYEPEVFLNFDTRRTLLTWTNRIAGVGAVHQSNGRTEPNSRNWNRVYANFVLEKNDFLLSVKPWLRIPEGGSDNNPDIEKYMGYGEIRLVYPLRGCTFSLLLRNNLRWSGNKGALELAYSYPVNRYVKGYLQFFNGYGECLLDYNHPSNRISLGVALSDWL